MLAVDVVQHWLDLPLFSVGYLSHADGTLGTIEPIQKFLLHLSPTINGFWLKVGIPIKGTAFSV